jgi:hypothetical protein
MTATPHAEGARSRRRPGARQVLALGLAAAATALLAGLWSAGSGDPLEATPARAQTAGRPAAVPERLPAAPQLRAIRAPAALHLPPPRQRPARRRAARATPAPARAASAVLAPAAPPVPVAAPTAVPVPVATAAPAPAPAAPAPAPAAPAPPPQAPATPRPAPPAPKPTPPPYVGERFDDSGSFDSSG